MLNEGSKSLAHVEQHVLKLAVQRWKVRVFQTAQSVFYFKTHGYMGNLFIINTAYYSQNNKSDYIQIVVFLNSIVREQEWLIIWILVNFSYQLLVSWCLTNNNILSFLWQGRNPLSFSWVVWQTRLLFFSCIWQRREEWSSCILPLSQALEISNLQIHARWRRTFLQLLPTCPSFVDALKQWFRSTDLSF